MDQAVKYSSRSVLWNITDSLVITLSTIAIVWFLRWLWNRRMIYYHTWNVKGPRAFPLIGNMHMFALGSTTEDILATLIDIQRDYPELAVFWFGPELVYLVSTPEHIEKVLTSPHCLSKDSLYRFISGHLGDGLLTLPASKWKKERKLINPSFNLRILESFVEIFQNQALILRDVLEKHVGETNFDISHCITKCTLDIICETAMGVQVNAQTSEVCELAKNADKMMEACAMRIFHVYYHPEMFWRLTSLSKVQDEAIHYYNTFCMDIIKRKYEAHQQKLKDQKAGVHLDVEDGGSKKIKAFLDLLLEDGTLNEEELKAEVNIFIVAGTDTTATALTAIILCLAMHPDIQEKVYQEIISIMGPDRRIDPSDFSQMKYMELIIKETLRVFPVAPFFVRRIDEDLDLGDAVLAKGCSAFFGTVHIHRNPKYWDDPLKFDPDRFLPENVAKRHPCTYIPFSYGSRNCIGGRYAMMNMKTILSTILRRYRFTSSYKSIADVDMGVNITLRFPQGTKLTVHER